MSNFSWFSLKMSMWKTNLIDFVIKLLRIQWKPWVITLICVMRRTYQKDLSNEYMDNRVDGLVWYRNSCHKWINS